MRSYNNGYSDYKGQFKKFLTEKMEIFNKYDTNLLNEMEQNFQSTMAKIRQFFGETPFAKYRYEKDNFKKMSGFNAAVFDAVTYPFSKLADGREPSYEKFKQLFADPVFFSAVEGSVNDSSKIENRITKSMQVIN